MAHPLFARVILQRIEGLFPELWSEPGGDRDDDMGALFLRTRL